MKKALVSIIFIFFLLLRSFATLTLVVNTTASGCTGPYDGSITVNVTNGTPPYTYSIDGSVYFLSNTFVGLAPGNHTVFAIDAMGDTGSSSTTVGAAGLRTYSYLDTAVCQNGLPYLFNGISINSSGTYLDTLANSTGCDSIIILGVVIIPVIQSTEGAQVCTSQLPYTWNGQSYNTAGTYTVTLTSSSGCDSIVNLFLSVTNTNEWIGTGNTSWEDPANWSCGAIPGPLTDVVINSGTVIVHANTTVNTLTVGPGATLTVMAGINLTVLH